MKKNYLIPSTKVISSRVSSAMLSQSPSDPGSGKGGTGAFSKDFSGYKDAAGSDDDFWSTAQ